MISVPRLTRPTFSRVLPTDPGLDVMVSEALQTALQIFFFQLKQLLCTRLPGIESAHITAPTQGKTCDLLANKNRGQAVHPSFKFGQDEKSM
jgi:hypothetical protein